MASSNRNRNMLHTECHMSKSFHNSFVFIRTREAHLSRPNTISGVGIYMEDNLGKVNLGCKILGTNTFLVQHVGSLY